jgi:serine/threonine protein kinase
LTFDDDRPSGKDGSTFDRLLSEVARAAPRAPVETDDALIGEVIDGKYRIDSLLGRGGMGTVYRATHLGTGRAVAVKVLVAGLTTDEDAVERFRREARAAGQMRHPNVVDVTDFGFAERGERRFAYLVMELLQGKTLRALLEAERTMPVDRAIDVLDQVCAALGEAHGRGILHRDLKPENIHLEPSARGYAVKVLDFGIAKLLHGASSGSPTASSAPLPIATTSSLAETLPTPPSGPIDPGLTRLGAALGTPLYMSPEQWLGEGIDARADVYSLGVVAYEMLTGAPPFEGKERWIGLEHARDPPPALVERAPSVPHRIARVIEAALAKEPDARPPSATAFAAALHAGTETTGTLLRRSIAFCIEHYALLSRRCAVGTVPPVALSVIVVASGLLPRVGAADAGVVTFVGRGVNIAAGVFAALSWASLGGLVVPVVANLVAPRGLRSPLPSVETWRTLRGALPSALAVLGVALLATVVTALPLNLLANAYGLGRYGTLLSMLVSIVADSAATAPFTVYPAAVAVEGARGLAPLWRSARLMRPVWRAAFGVQLFYSLLAQLLPALVPLVLKEVASGLVLPADTERAAWLVTWLTAAALMPFFVVPAAMLYLRARDAEGQPLGTG